MTKDTEMWPGRTVALILLPGILLTAAGYWPAGPMTAAFALLIAAAAAPSAPDVSETGALDMKYMQPPVDYRAMGADQLADAIEAVEELEYLDPELLHEVCRRLRRTPA